MAQIVQYLFVCFEHVRIRNTLELYRDDAVPNQEYIRIYSAWNFITVKHALNVLRISYITVGDEIGTDNDCFLNKRMKHSTGSRRIDRIPQGKGGTSFFWMTEKDGKGEPSSAPKP